MNTDFKPTGYNCVSPYFITAEAQRFIDQLKQIFDLKELRRYQRDDGSIIHAEIQIDDSVLMLADATENYPAVSMVMHVYVPNVDETFEKAVEAGCEIIHPPKVSEGDPDRRASFRDFGGNLWSVSTQLDN